MLQRDIKKKGAEIEFKNEEIGELETQTTTLREKAARDKARAKEHEARCHQLTAQVETQEKLIHNLQVGAALISMLYASRVCRLNVSLACTYRGAKSREGTDISTLACCSMVYSRCFIHFRFLTLLRNAPTVTHARMD